MNSRANINIMTANPRNSTAAIQQRDRQGLILWPAPVFMVLSRTVFTLLAQALVAVGFFLTKTPSSWQVAGAWWNVWSTLVDLACLSLLLYLTRREGIRLTDLLSLDRRRILGDVLLGIGYFVVLFPLASVGGVLLSSLLVYGSLRPELPALAPTAQAMPGWAIVYSQTVWWLVWSFTEQLTYQGYCLPRLEVLFGRRWAAVLLVGLAWALQHSMLPLVPDLRYLVWRFLGFLPLVIVLPILYIRERRLLPFIVAQYGMDIASSIFTMR
jgi:hypothetical protein